MNNSYCVYQAVNAELREVVVGVSSNPDLRLIQDIHRRVPPTGMSQWQPYQPIEYRVVVKDLELGQAADFANKYSRSVELKPFRVILTS